jgi:hypothetical protein
MTDAWEHLSDEEMARRVEAALAQRQCYFCGEALEPEDMENRRCPALLVAF